MSQHRPDAVVVGAGVIGLTTGICLAEAGLRVLIRTAALPAHTTSAVAGALIGPVFAAPGHPPGDVVTGWERTGIAEFTRLSADPGTGAHLCRGLFAARPAAVEGGAPPLDEVPEVRLCRPGELPDGFGFGFWATLPLVDMERYLGYLADRFAAAGGEIQVRPAASLAEAAGEAPLLANCTGIGAHHLVPDPSVRPVRGQHVVVANPGIETFFLEAPLGPSWTGFLPHGDRVVLGGVADQDDWNTAPDPAVAAEIVRRCAEVEPRLAKAEVVAHMVGLRPARPTVRLEAEQVGGARCVHNYGHGGSGVALSWGTARVATDLLLAGRGDSAT
jgi:D-amino-acid oxidase